MSPPPPNLQAAIAVTRFGLGAKPGEMAQASSDPRAFLKSQIRPAGGADQPPAQLKSSAQVLAEYGEYKTARRDVRQSNAAATDEQRGQALAAQKRQAFTELRQTGEWREILARDQLAATTDAGFRERWTRFWSNHFTVSGAKPPHSFFTGPFEREAIRPHVFGRFEDMLLASTQHPGMLIYLDQANSVGPGSPVGAGGRGLNENLAREIMELHTVGLGAGYTQEDVTEFAKALTGWSINADPSATPGPFLFKARAHEPGDRKIMGRTYRDTGEAQGRAVLRDLAANPETGRHIARKLAQHFVADAPPPASVDRLAQAYASSDGRLDRVAVALIDSPEAWEVPARKFKTPSDFVISSWRALGHTPAEPMESIRPLQAMGQRPLTAPSPKGWPEEAAGWAAPAELLKRINLAEALVGQSQAPGEPAAVAMQALGPLLSAPVAKAMAQAETRPEALAILLMSPEFQRR